jgi:hypothetical protein
MSIVLLNPQWIIDRLIVEVGELKSVGGSADFTSAADAIKRKPSAFVLPSSERPSASSTGTMVTSQLNAVRFGVVIAVQNLRDSRGENAQDDLLPIRTRILTALHGWQPNEDFDPIEYGGGRLLQLKDQVLWWQDEFLTANTIRSL